MYVGKFVEVAATGDLFQQPAHPYTKALLASIPVPKAKVEDGFTLEGDVPSPITTVRLPFSSALSASWQRMSRNRARS